MKTVTLPLANTTYNLLDLMRVVDPNAPTKAIAIKLQGDPDAGVAKWKMGNSDASDIMWGQSLRAGQATGFESLQGNALPLASFHLRTDTPGLLIGVTAMVL